MAGGIERVKACRVTRHGASDRAMTGVEKSREERLAEALRENLRRRKAQTREGEPSARPVLGAEPGGDE